MTDIETKVIESLRADADRVITSDGLRDGAIARAGTIRRQRNFVGVVAAAGLVAVLTAGIAVTPHLFDAGTGNSNNPAGQPGAPILTAPGPRPGPTSAPGPTTLPELTDVRPAGEDPTGVGTDPLALHFDVDLAAVGATVSDWLPRPGYEAVGIWTRSGPGSLADIEIYLSPTFRFHDTRASDGTGVVADGEMTPLTSSNGEAVTVSGRPGTVQKVDSREATGWVLRWQPVDGLYATVQVRNADRAEALAEALAAAAALRLDHSQRCAAAWQVTGVPAGAKVVECRTKVRRVPLAGRGVWVMSGVTVELVDRHRFMIWVEDLGTRNKRDADKFRGGLTVAGYPAQWFTAEGSRVAWLWVPNITPAKATITELSVWGAGDRETVGLVENLVLAVNLAQPTTWPQHPLG